MSVRQCVKNNPNQKVNQKARAEKSKSKTSKIQNNLQKTHYDKINYIDDNLLTERRTSVLKLS